MLKIGENGEMYCSNCGKPIPVGASVFVCPSVECDEEGEPFYIDYCCSKECAIIQDKANGHTDERIN